MQINKPNVNVKWKQPNKAKQTVKQASAGEKDQRVGVKLTPGRFNGPKATTEEAQSSKTTWFAWSRA